MPAVHRIRMDLVHCLRFVLVIASVIYLPGQWSTSSSTVLIHAEETLPNDAWSWSGCRCSSSKKDFSHAVLRWIWFT
jgi:hypothetical protein